MPPLDDSPYPRHPPHRPAAAVLGWVAAVVLAAAAGAAYYLWSGTPAAPARPNRAPTVQEKTPAPAAPASRPPLDASRAGKAAIALPVLDQSDAALWQALAGLLGTKTLAELLKPEQIARRIVATVDNLPREAAASRAMPLTVTPGTFVIKAKGDETVIGPGNPARYASRIRILQAIDARRLVDLYLDFYPLLQQAYVELGYPGGYFNDRLIEALDDLLAAPDIMTPVTLVRPKVLYLYADSALEARSAGQKIMLRIGVGNAGLVKAKLREIRREILSRAPRQ